MFKPYFLFLLAFTASCGEDLGSNTKLAENRSLPQVTTPEIGTEGLAQIRSPLHREKGSPALSYAEETQKLFDGSLSPALYRAVPLMEKDDEGSAKNVSTVDTIGRPSVNCGSSDLPSVSAKIDDCFQKNADKSRWEGVSFGASGEGTWKLVVKNNEREIWLDGRTGMLWSYLLPASSNWCKASGNTEGVTPDTTVDCQTLGAGESACSGALLEEVGNQVKWRLPTRNDYLQADLNGLRFVLKKENETGAWTATLRAAAEGRAEAWVYFSQEGTLSPGSLSTLRQVRCIGAYVQ